jgi:uncharacterized protein (TIGR02001 family)
MKATRVAALMVLLAAGSVRAEVTGTAGFLSDYVFRGIFQADSVGNGALDYSENGFYLGTWWADVGQGLEVDGYGGYSHDFGTFRYTVGYTGYFYTDDFDDTYQEINLRGGYGHVGLEYNAGRYDNFDGPTLDYGFTLLSISYDHVHAMVGSFSQDFDGDYVQIGVSGEVATLNLGLDVIYSDKDLVGDEDNTTVVFSISKAFTLKE